MGGRGTLPHAASDNVGQGEMQSAAGGQACVRGSFCEVAEKESVLVAKIKEGGAVVHTLSGRVNIRVAEPFDQVKVAVKLGEIDWLHIVPEGSWCNLDRVITRVVKLCRVARRRGIWFSLENPNVSPLWACRKVKSLFDEDEMRVVSAQSSQVLTNVGCWDAETNINTLVENFSRFINKALGTHPAEVTITMDGATGFGLQKSLRAIREEENECAIGGLRNAARSVAKLPGWSLVGVKVASIVEELVDQNEGELEQVLDSLGDKTKSCCVPETLCAQLRQR